jgi:recombination protein RecR
MIYPKSLERLIEELKKMPGIGPKSAQRIALYFLKIEDFEKDALIEAFKEVKEKITYCSICFNISETNPCEICSDIRRDSSVICVVEHPQDVIAFEKTGIFKGVYHVLQGAISPLEGINPEDLRIKELLARISKNQIKEIIIATNPDAEGEATAIYLSKLLKPLSLKITRLSYGLPVGADIDYADELTLSKALEGRREL